jgi:hypothetical protein
MKRPAEAVVVWFIAVERPRRTLLQRRDTNKTTTVKQQLITTLVSCWVFGGRRQGMTMGVVFVVMFVFAVVVVVVVVRWFCWSFCCCFSNVLVEQRNNILDLWCIVLQLSVSPKRTSKVFFFDVTRVPFRD